MSDQIKFKAEETAVDVTFTPSGGVIITLDSDTTPLQITVKSPNKNSTTEFIGGRPKRN